MATIALYADKVNQMPELVRDVKKAVLNYKAELTALKNKSLKIAQDICNMEDVVSSIQASSQTQEEKIASLEAFQQKNEEFIEDISVLTMKWPTSSGNGKMTFMSSIIT